MRKVLNKVIAFIILFMLIFSLKVDAKTNGNYRTNTLNILGLKIEFRDREFFNAGNTEVTEEEKINNNKAVAIFGGILVIYWLVLLIIFEKEDSYEYSRQYDDIEILEKYNPMIAGGLVDNRQVLPRDITAVILNLIKKEVINMKMVPNSNENDKETYKYFISENKNSTVQLDEIERYVMNWIFGFYEQEEVELLEKLKEISKRKEFIKNLKKLNKITQTKLNSMGANINKVPLYLQITNIFLVVFSVMLAVVHITNNGLSIHIYETTLLILLAILLGVLIILPIIALIIHFLLVLVVFIKKLIKSKADEHSGKQIVTTSVLILISMCFALALTYMFIPDKYICLDVFVIGMSILIVKTDHLMRKHTKKILHDYYALREVKGKIEEYSLIKDKQINYIKLWEDYLIYAVAFGVPIQIVDKLENVYQEDKDIQYLLKCENLYYIFKSYFQVMIQMNKYMVEKESGIINQLFRLTD